MISYSQAKGVTKKLPSLRGSDGRRFIGTRNEKQLQNLAVCALLAIPTLGFAGGDAPLEAAEEYVYKVRQVSIPEAEQLFMEPGVRIFDVNTLELWAEGYIPGAVFFNVGNWKKLLPKDKNTLIVFYCANRLCSSSQIAAYETMKLGYTNVWQMPDGIYGWKLSGRQVELP